MKRAVLSEELVWAGIHKTLVHDHWCNAFYETLTGNGGFDIGSGGRGLVYLCLWFTPHVEASGGPLSQVVLTGSWLEPGMKA